jgi:hypothetical protein
MCFDCQLHCSTPVYVASIRPCTLTICVNRLRPCHYSRLNVCLQTGRMAGRDAEQQHGRYTGCCSSTCFKHSALRQCSRSCCGSTAMCERTDTRSTAGKGPSPSVGSPHHGASGTTCYACNYAGNGTPSRVAASGGASPACPAVCPGSSSGSSPGGDRCRASSTRGSPFWYWEPKWGPAVFSWSTARVSEYCICGASCKQIQAQGSV